MVEPVAPDLTLNGNPYTAPRAFSGDGVHQSIGILRVTTPSEFSVGDLVRVDTDKSCVLADASSEIEATHVVVRVITAGVAQVAAWADLELTVSGAGETGTVIVYLGESGAAGSSPASSGLHQEIGRAISYDASTGKHRCIIQPTPAAAIGGV